MTQLLCHLWGDYILQSEWMAANKTSRYLPAAIHAVLYTLVFLFLTWSPLALGIICLSHFLIDRFRLARYVLWTKNWMAPWALDYWEQRMNWRICSRTGFVPEARGGPPAWMQVWLLIIVDNTLHLTINYLALRFA
jgi:hypothetical protein